MKIYGLRAPLPFLKSHVRHVRPIWLMEEIGAAYDVHYLDLEKEEEASPTYLAVNPFGKVPALEDGAVKMCESGAICSYLADKHGKLIPRAGTPERALHDQWMYASVAMIEPHTVRLLAADFFYKDEPEAPLMKSMALESLEENLPPIEAQLAKTAYIAGNDFTVADVMMTATLRLASHTDLFAKYPKISAYIAKNAARPAFQRAAEQQ